MGKTRLDKERLVWSQREIETIISNSRSIKLNLNDNNLKEQLKKMQKIVTVLNDLGSDVCIAPI